MPDITCAIPEGLALIPASHTAYTVLSALTGAPVGRLQHDAARTGTKKQEERWVAVCRAHKGCQARSYSVGARPDPCAKALHFFEMGLTHDKEAHMALER